jgi:L-rhamnose mutarotase
VLAALRRAHITDYSIYHYPPLQLLIATFKYTGQDYAADMAKVAEDPETQKWWELTDGMQESFVDGATGSGNEIPWWQVNVFSSYRFFMKFECLYGFLSFSNVENVTLTAVWGNRKLKKYSGLRVEPHNDGSLGSQVVITVWVTES